MPVCTHNSIEIFYEQKGHGAPILLLPGIGTGGNMWSPVVDTLSQSRRCISMDTRGAGHSTVPKSPLTIDELAADIEQFIHVLEIEKPTIAGHSMGGFVALAVATRANVSLSGLVLVSTAAAGVAEKGGVTRAGSKIMTDSTASRSAAIARISELGLGKRASKEKISQLRQLALSRPLRGSGYLAQLAAVRAFDLRVEISKIRVPCCVVHGTEDRIIPLSSGEYLAKTIPQAALVSLTEVGHFPIIERPDAVAEVITNLTKNVFPLDLKE